MRITLLTLFGLLTLLSPTLGDKHSYKDELARRRAARAGYSAARHGTRQVSKRASIRLEQIAREQRFHPNGPDLTPRCAQSRANGSQVAATLAYFRYYKMQYQIPQSMQRLLDAAKEQGDPVQSTSPTRIPSRTNL